MLMTETINAQFEINSNKNVSGVLLDVKKYKFNCWSSEFFFVENHSRIYGKTQDNKTLSLLNCLGSDSRTFGAGSSTYSSVIQPHIALTGSRSVDPDTDSFSSISLVVGGSHTLLGWFESFGYIHFPDDELISKLNTHEHSPSFDSEHNPILAYFNGDFNIFSQDTGLGIISAGNHIYAGGGFSSDGVSIKNNVILKIEFHSSKTLNEALNSAHKVSLFLRFNAGEGVYFKDISIDDDSGETFQVLYNTYSWGEVPEESKPNNPLIDIANNQFPKVLKTWFSHDERDIVRYSFYDVFLKGRSYSSDRLINAANMFDIFPAPQHDSKKTLTKQETEKTDKLKRYIKEEFADLESIKNSLLMSIGFLTRKSLKDRVNERLDIVKNYLISRGFDLKDIELVLGLAIKTRNYHVHGTEFKQLTLHQMHQFQILFTCFFELIYALSELIECGWGKENISHRNDYHPVLESERYLKSEIVTLKNTVEENKKSPQCN